MCAEACTCDRTPHMSKLVLPMLLGTLAANMLGSALTGRGGIRAGEGTLRVGGHF